MKLRNRISQFRSKTEFWNEIARGGELLRTSEQQKPSDLHIGLIRYFLQIRCSILTADFENGKTQYIVGDLTKLLNMRNFMKPAGGFSD